MKKIFWLLILSTLLFSSCKNTSEFTIGYTEPAIPITITLDSYGNMGLSIEGSWISPIGKFSIYEEIPSHYLSSHHTKIILKETTKGSLYIFELLHGENFYYKDDYKTFLEIQESINCTTVIVSSEEINHFLKVNRVKKPKPEFPNHPIAYFWISKKINIDWSIHSVSDIFLNIIFSILYVFILIFDIILIIVIKIFQVIWFFLIGIFYFFSTLF